MCKFIGQYAGTHGVTGNQIYDRNQGKLIKYSREMFIAKRNITPIWTLNELSGKHSAISMWPAAEFEYRGKKPQYIELYNRSTHWKDRINNIIPLLKRDDSPVDLAMFYLNQPDKPSHLYSSSSKQVNEFF